MREKVKEYLGGTFGVIGVVLYYLLGIALWILSLAPMAFLDLTFLGYCILTMLILIPFIGNITHLVLWCITFSTVIAEPFSTATHLYYIGFVVYVLGYAIPFIMSIVAAIVESFRR